MSKWTQRELSLIKKFSDKLKLRFNNVSRAWHHVNSKLGITGKISTKEFSRMLEKEFIVEMQEKDLNEFIRVFDRDQNGFIDFSEFQAIIHPVLQPEIVSAEHCTGLPISKSIAQEHINRGKGHSFHYDIPVTFNNKFRQTLDESGMPLLKNIFAGAYEKTNEAPTKKMETNQEFNFPRSESGSVLHSKETGKKAIVPSSLLHSDEFNVPLVKAVVEGSWYGDKYAGGGVGYPIETLKSGRDCLREHRRTIGGYSQMVKSIKPMRRKSPSPYLQGAVLPLQPNGTCAPKLPTSAEEVYEVYGRLTDPKAAESMANFLSAASPKEKQRYLKTIKKATANTDILLQALGETGSTLNGNQRKTAGFLRKTDVSLGHEPPSRPASSLGHLLPRQQNLSFGRSAEGWPENGSAGEVLSAGPQRPLSVASGAMSKTISHGNLLDEATNFRRAMKAHARPESAMSGLNSNVVRASQMRPTTAKIISPNMAHLSATNVIPNRVQQKDHVGNRMHLDVQKSAFGASFSAKRIDLLLKKLNENVDFASGH